MGHFGQWQYQSLYWPCTVYKKLLGVKWVSDISLGIAPEEKITIPLWSLFNQPITQQDMPSQDSVRAFYSTRESSCIKKY